VVACRQGQKFPEYSCVYDERSDLGPIAGVQAAMLVTRLPLLVISCDLPFMNDATIQRLVSAHAARPPNAIMTTFRRAETGFIEPLTSIYTPDCLSLFTRAISKGRRRLRLIIAPDRRHDIVYTESEARPFLNINTPEELEQARTLANDGRNTAVGAIESDQARHELIPDKFRVSARKSGKRFQEAPEHVDTYG
jgi:molybdopterin-guanine dinucleotide biosynthesis protein A